LHVEFNAIKNAVEEAHVTQRQDFAHLLRGIAAISVVLAHYCGIFFQAHVGITALLQVPPLPSLPEVTGPAKLLGEFAIVAGEFGVGIFFIISGFVIPFSLTSESRWRFLKRRIFRIYPVYIAGFGLVMISVWLLTRFAGSYFGYSSNHIVAHFGIILRGLTGYSRIDGISWTLEVELLFYLIMALGGIRLISKGPGPFCVGAIGMAAAAIVINQFMRSGAAVGLIGLQFWASLLLVSGLAYHSLHSGKLDFRAFLSIQLTVSVLLIVVWFCTDRDVFHWQWIAGYLLAMAVFAVCYALREKIRSRGVLNHLANISYPLYVVHALPGYAVMYCMISLGMGVYGAILAASGMAYGLSLLLHIGIEKRFMQAAHRPVSSRRAIAASPA
jgi:peptidoglycan/LPS O-acetylase OafA/YrhL